MLPRTINLVDTKVWKKSRSAFGKALEENIRNLPAPNCIEPRSIRQPLNSLPSLQGQNLSWLHCQRQRGHFSVSSSGISTHIFVEWTSSLTVSWIARLIAPARFKSICPERAVYLYTISRVSDRLGMCLLGNYAYPLSFRRDWIKICAFHDQEWSCRVSLPELCIPACVLDTVIDF